MLQRDQVRARRCCLLQECVESRDRTGRSRHPNRHNLRVIRNVAKKPGQCGLSTRTLRGDQRQVRFDVEHLALGA
jgi:hypothetical protein